MDRKIATIAAVAVALIAGSAAAQAAPSPTHAAPAVSLEKVQFSLQFGARPDYRYRERERRDWYLRHGYVWNGRDWVPRDRFYRYHRRYYDYDYYDR